MILCTTGINLGNCKIRSNLIKNASRLFGASLVNGFNLEMIQLRIISCGGRKTSVRPKHMVVNHRVLFCMLIKNKQTRLKLQVACMGWSRTHSKLETCAEVLIIQ